MTSLRLLLATSCVDMNDESRDSLLCSNSVVAGRNQRGKRAHDALSHIQP